jgi:hydrogenase maturation protein HypF
MVDASLEEMTTIVVDGVGYGDDGLSWGGEVIHTKGEEYIRAGQLEEFGLPGGDGASYHPERIAYWLTQEAGEHLDLEDLRTMEVLSSSHRKAVMTSSLGRVLDGLSSLMLGIKERTYDGEPAIRLEKLLISSRKPRFDLFELEKPDHKVSIIRRWKTLLEEVRSISDKKLRPGLDLDYDVKADLSMGFVGSIIDDMVHIAVETEKMIDERRKPLVGISGGVSYNIPILTRFVDACLEHGAMPVLHSRVPPGDGGISVGQAYIAGLRLD